MKHQLRNLAISLLDDDEGINEAAWESLRTLLLENDCEDIVSKVEAGNDRFYLPEDHELEV